MSDVVTGWTGRSACALQTAKRMTNEAFAEHLGVAPRTVQRWHDKPASEPISDVQAALDTALERATSGERARFAELHTPPAAPTQASGEFLRVAIAVVVDNGRILLVRRREDNGGIRWQFPAGMVKPGGSSEAVAVQETHNETGAHVAVQRHLGTRLHPVTNVDCDYWLCDYLAGDVENRDVVENIDVVWCPIPNLSRFIPPEQVYPPVLEALEEHTHA